MTVGGDSDRGIEQRLDVLIHLLTAIVTKDMTRKEAVLTLAASGLQPKAIADVLGLTSNQVSVVLYDARQTAAKGEPKAKRPPKS
jgi:DNA-binding CsgD family transcriptional regulator